MNKNKKYIVITAAAVIILCLLMVTVPFLYEKNEYARYNLDNKEIVRMEYVRYEDEPFRSVIKEKRAIKQTQSNKELFNSFKEEAKNADIVMLDNKETTNEVLFIYFSDGSELSAYIDGDKIGIDYGKMWVTNTAVRPVIEKMDKQKIVDNIKK